MSCACAAFVALVALIAFAHIPVVRSEGAAEHMALEQLSRYNFLIGVAQVGVQHEHGGGNATKCGRELEALLKAAVNREFWCLKVLDSFGAAPQSFGWGNYFWFAPQSLCDDLNTPYSISFSAQHERKYHFNVTAPFPLRFTLVYLNFTTPFYIDLKLPFENFIHLGLCLPQSCDSSAIMKYTQSYFQRQTFEMQQNFALQLEAVETKTPTFSWQFLQRTGSILFITICLLAVLFAIMAELVHKSANKWKIQTHLHAKTTTTAPLTTLQATPTTTTPTLPLPQPPPTLSSHYHHTKSSLSLEALLACFRLGENYKSILQLENSKSFLSAIAGLRTIICLWVTVFHVYYYSLFAMSNAPLIFAKLEHITLQPMMQACFYVDVFFVMSAFLLVYNFLANAEQQKLIRRNSFGQNSLLFFRGILHRYMRLTPVLVLTMLLSDMTYDFLNMYSPFRLGVHSGIYCKTTWWYNLLYIHNLLDMQDICCSWTWYLGCEMQFFVLFTALLFVHAKNAKVARMLFVTLALGFVATAWWCNFSSGITFQIDVIYTTLNELYVRPWVRITPYIGGAALGYLLHCYPNAAGKSGRDTKLSALWRACFWLLCFVLYVATNFMSFFRSAPSWLVATIMSCGKLLFAVCVGGVIVLCAWNYGKPLNALLSARPFLFLNKFCFCIYMAAPVVVMATFGLRNEATSFTEVASGMDFFAVIVLSIAAAFLLVLLVELPMQRVTNLLLRRRTLKEQKAASP